MGYDIYTWRSSIEGRLSRHNDRRDEQDDEAWDRLCEELDEAVLGITDKPEYDHIMHRATSDDDRGLA